MAGQFGVKESKELVGFGLGLVNAVGKGLEDGKLEISEAMLLLPTLLKAPEAFGGISQIKSELGELDGADLAELKAYVESEFDIPQDKIESAIEKGIDLALKIYEAIVLFKKA